MATPWNSSTFYSCSQGIMIHIDTCCFTSWKWFTISTTIFVNAWLSDHTSWEGMHLNYIWLVQFFCGGKTSLCGPKTHTNCSLKNIFCPVVGTHFKSPNTITELVWQMKKNLQTFFPELHRGNIVWRCLASCQLEQSPGPCQCSDLHSTQRRPETSKLLWIKATWCCTLGQVKWNNATQALLWTTVPRMHHRSENKSRTHQCHDRNNKTSWRAFTKVEQRLSFYIVSLWKTLIFLYFRSEDFCIISVNTGDRWVWQSKQGLWIKYDRLNKELQESVAYNSESDVQLLSRQFLTATEKDCFTSIYCKTSACFFSHSSSLDRVLQYISDPC